MDSLQRAEAIAGALGILVERISELGGGNQNHVVRVQGGSQDVVVRFAKDDARMLVDPFDVEAWCLGVAVGAGIHTSRLVARGFLDGVSYLVVGHLAGAVAAFTDREAWREIGRSAAALQRVDVATAPDVLFSRFGRDLDAAWNAHVGYNVDALGDDDPLCALGVYRAPARTVLRDALIRLRRRRLRQGLVHGDLSTRNLLVSDGYAVIDWGSAHAGPVCWGDLDRINRWRLLRDPDVPVSETAWAAVIEGADLTLAASEPVLVELAVLHALDVVRWARERRPGRLDELVQQSAHLLSALGLTS